MTALMLERRKEITVAVVVATWGMYRRISFEEWSCKRKSAESPKPQTPKPLNP
jgi:hypothetical protein